MRAADDGRPHRRPDPVGTDHEFRLRARTVGELDPGQAVVLARALDQPPAAVIFLPHKAAQAGVEMIPRHVQLRRGGAINDATGEVEKNPLPRDHADTRQMVEPEQTQGREDILLRHQPGTAPGEARARPLIDMDRVPGLLQQRRRKEPAERASDNCNPHHAPFPSVRDASAIITDRNSGPVAMAFMGHILRFRMGTVY
ncbi:hypothetical protein D9M73_119140 [compost metagenome]